MRSFDNQIIERTGEHWDPSDTACQTTSNQAEIQPKAEISQELTNWVKKLGLNSYSVCLALSILSMWLEQAKFNRSWREVSQSHKTCTVAYFHV